MIRDSDGVQGLGRQLTEAAVVFPLFQVIRELKIWSST